MFSFLREPGNWWCPVTHHWWVRRRGGTVAWISHSMVVVMGSPIPKHEQRKAPRKLRRQK